MAEKENKIEKKKENVDTLLLQWQTCVESANVVSQRRDVINGLFVTLNLATITTIVALWGMKAVTLLVAGIVICVSWLLYISSFKMLNKAKFDVINDMEAHLPAQPFNDEWNALSKDERYVKGSDIEKVLPVSFLIIYTTLSAFLFICN